MAKGIFGWAAAESRERRRPCLTLARPGPGGAEADSGIALPGPFRRKREPVFAWPTPPRSRGPGFGARRRPFRPDQPRSVARALIAEARPKQWVKNVLVVAAPAAAGVLGERDAIFDTLVAFVAFCLAASGTYFLNDAFDVEADRLHAKKRFRPVAAGDVPVRTAQVVGVLLILCGIGVGFLTGWKLPVVIATYIIFTTTYSAWLKHVAVVDLGMVAAGFVLRLIAGAVAVDVPISVWFFIVGSFGSLFMVAGKRHAEHLDLGVGRAGHRATLSEYSLEYLGYVRSVASGVAMVGYCLWAFEKSTGHGGRALVRALHRPVRSRDAALRAARRAR